MGAPFLARCEREKWGGCIKRHKIEQEFNRMLRTGNSETPKLAIKLSSASPAPPGVLPPESKTGGAPGPSYAGNSNDHPPEIQGALPIRNRCRSFRSEVRNAAVSFNRALFRSVLSEESARAYLEPAAKRRKNAARGVSRGKSQRDDAKPQRGERNDTGSKQRSPYAFQNCRSFCRAIAGRIRCF